MKKNVYMVFMFLGITATAATTQSGFKIETHFNYQDNKNNIATQSTFILAENNKAWITLTEPKNGIALLGHVVKADKTSLHLEYIVIDTKKNNAVVSTPALITRFGEKAEFAIGSESNKDKIAISLLVTPAQYFEKK